MSTILEASEEKTNGTRLARLLTDGGTHALRTLFDSIHPAPRLETALRNNSTTLQYLRSRRAIFDSQWEALYPPSGDPPDSQTFDITLLHLLLREICYLARPATGWNDLPGDADLSPEAHIVRIKYFRNELCHSISTGIRNAEFNDKWNKISSSLTALGFDHNEINRLKNEPIDHLTEDRVKAEVQKWTLDFETQIQGLKQDVKQVKDEMARINQSSSGKTSDGLGSCLPDEVTIFGRSQEIRAITGAVQPGQAAVVVITGGPGFGKTTVANKVAHELANQSYRNTVLFCPLKSKTTAFDVATSMILACSTNHCQPSENPQHWLLNWGKQQMENVTFVLDNADDVLQSDERTQFTSILRDMRILSRQKVTFVVTSRRVFKDSSLKMTEVRLEPLSLDESMKIIVSRLPHQSREKDLCKTKKLVELCGCVPLALCIVGSLLSDYTEEELIKLLEEKPLEVLREDESDDNSVEKAIKTSFDVLSKIEQDALILLSAFPGSFSPKAANHVITNGTKCSTQAISLLRSLKNRSLVEQPIATSNRYQIHPLIQAFLKKMDEDIQIVNQGRRAACSYFISCLDGNANLYWSKDTCKESITRFNKDRHNFEYFIKACICGLRNNDPDDVAIMETLLKKASPISSIYRYLYLGKILLPTVYVEFLEVSCKLLTSSKQSASKIVMLLCLLGHESRNAGDLTKYEEYVQKATKVHSQNSLEFDNDKLAEAFFQNNIARFLAEQGKLDEAKEQYHFCLEICKEHSSVDGMPAQKAITLCFAGAEHNRRDERFKAEEQFNEALDIYQQALGEHVLTASVYRGLGDFYLFHGEKSLGSAEDQHKSMKLYEKALAMFDNLGLSETKECILSLTNLGICFQSQGELQEAMERYQTSWNIAERELRDDHKWKIYVKIQIAYLHKVMGNMEDARVHKNEAMQMSERLGLPDDQPKNKFLLRKI
ncbi:uncharacterized protein [Montipora capricornis]|uniref:uncharacterized protein n=1 Tax=Montipora capricornis TaxID=246305 RepID=UPI0035F12D8E